MLAVDAGSNESHHKVTKVAAKLTQRDQSKFEYQTALRLMEFFLIALAICELDGLIIWECSDENQLRGDDVYEPVPDVDDDFHTTGATINVVTDLEKQGIPSFGAHVATHHQADGRLK